MGSVGKFDMTVLLLATFFATVQPAAANAPRTFSILRYNTPGTAFIKAGLGAWPMVMDYDGKPDLIMNSDNIILWRQVRAENGCWRFARQGNLADEKLAGHTTSPCACDFDGDGVADLLVGAEDGFFYHLANLRSRERR